MILVESMRCAVVDRDYDMVAVVLWRVDRLDEGAASVQNAIPCRLR